MSKFTLGIEVNPIVASQNADLLEVKILDASKSDDTRTENSLQPNGMNISKHVLTDQNPVQIELGKKQSEAFTARQDEERKIKSAKKEAREEDHVIKECQRNKGEREDKIEGIGPTQWDKIFGKEWEDEKDMEIMDARA